MKKLSSSKGMTLVELLAALSLVGIITIIIMNFMLSGMNSYEKTSNDVSLHNDANYVMSLFVNKIYQSKSANPDPDSNTIIVLEDYDGKTSKIGFKDEKAYIELDDGSAIYPSDYRFPQGEGESEIEVKDETVFIRIVIENEKNDSKMELINEVSCGKPQNPSEE